MILDKVCGKHFNDKYLQRFISLNGKRERCDICNKTKNCITIKAIASHIEKCIKFEYGEPYELGAPYDNSQTFYEDRFPGISVFSTDEILQDELSVTNDDLYFEICRRIETNTWCIHDFYGPTKHEFIKGGWEYFKQIVKYKIRYVFFDSRNKDLFYDNYEDTLNPFYVMEEIGETIKRLCLVKTLEPRTLKIFRGRQHSEDEFIKNAKYLGALHPSKAKANRMNPAGISMFYGGIEEETCIEEIIDRNWEDSFITTGQFENIESLNLIDFTEIKKVPSLFDLELRKDRELVKFILAFINDLSQPVKPDDSVHIEYVPTQIVSEYLKVFSPNNQKINGIIYNSVKNVGGKCVALFIDNNGCTDKYLATHVNSGQENQLSDFIGINERNKINPILELDNKTISRQKSTAHNKGACCTTHQVLLTNLA